MEGQFAQGSRPREWRLTKKFSGPARKAWIFRRPIGQLPAAAQAVLLNYHPVVGSCSHMIPPVLRGLREFAPAPGLSLERQMTSLLLQDIMQRCIVERIVC